MSVPSPPSASHLTTESPPCDMNPEVRGWIASAILAPICLVILAWTLVIFHSNRRKWQSKDVIVSTLLTQGVAKQVATFFYALLVLLKPIDYFETYCGCVKWLITSIDIFQAATIGTLVFTRLLAVRFPAKFRASVKRTHLYYHLITLGILSSCIGIASILAERIDDVADDVETVKYCTFLPYELNPKYAFLSIALNTVVNVGTIVALVWTLYCFCVKKHAKQKPGLTPSTIRKNHHQLHAFMTSTSDVSQLSDMSLRSVGNPNHRSAFRHGRHVERPTLDTHFGQYLAANSRFPASNEHYYGDVSIGKSSTDTLKSSKLLQNYHQLLNHSRSPGSTYDEIYSQATPVNRWASESSYLSTSTTSTNSRAPCLTQRQQSQREDNLGLITTIAIFFVCFLLNHLPFVLITMIGTFLPVLLPNWPLNAYLLWAGLVQDCLLPLILAAVDRDLKIWLRQVYRRQHKTPLAKHQGLDGKFRVFNTPLQSMQPIQLLHNEPMKFPITNGSLFTSVDGRLPIIHNYRRGQGQRTNGLLSSHCISMGLPAAMRRVEFNARAQHHEQQHNLNNNVDIPSFQHAERRKVHQLFNENLRRQDFRISNLDLEPFRSNTLDRSEFEDSNDFDSEPIYATLSSRSCCSATTAANDDFEFYQHDNLKVTDAINCTIMTDKFDGISVEDCVSNAKENSLLSIIEESNAIQTCRDQSNESSTLQTQDSNKQIETEIHNINDCLLRIQDELSSVLELTPNTHSPLIHQDNEVDSLVLESFNNLMHLHELRNTHGSQENGQTVSEISSDSFTEDEMPKVESNEEELVKHNKPSKVKDGITNMFDSEIKENRRLFKKTPLNRRNLEPQLTKRLNTPPTNRRLMKPKRLEKTPPICRRSLVEPRYVGPSLRREFSSRRHRPKKMLPVLSVDSLSAAISNAGVSYLDNGDLWRHGREIGGSVPDFKKIFVSDFI